MNYIFNLAPVDVNAYMAETTAALEKRTELLSREKYPKMWEKTDANNSKKPGKAKVPGRLISKPMSWALLLLGAGLFIPSMQDVLGRVIPLTAGAAAMVIGLRGIREAGDRFDKAAQNLLKGRAKLPENRYTVVFSDGGMAICDDGNEENFVTYDQFERIIETENTFLTFFGSRVIVLPKEDMAEGVAEDFARDISSLLKYAKI